jgi:cyclopropane-fatty-acyl-phospholipid synthase
MNLIDLAEARLLPDALVRIGIRRLLARRAHRASSRGPDELRRQEKDFAEQLRHSPLAVATDKANEQHYEVPAEFFQYVLGPRMKYSCCLFASARTRLAQAEEAMLQVTCQRAELADNMRVLDLGCGWGSLTLWIAEHYPGCTVTAVSNSTRQRAYIQQRAEAAGHGNVHVVTADMREFKADGQFDRVVSVEMFEHMRNYQRLLHRVAGWLTPQGKAFLHIFCHRDAPYLFQDTGTTDWMSRHFFTGGMMPSENLLRQFEEDLQVEAQWRVDGRHYWRTCEAWLHNLDRQQTSVLECLSRDLAPREARRTMQRWRMFFMACAELFRFRGGRQWFVSHYRLRHQPAVTGAGGNP